MTLMDATSHLRTAIEEFKHTGTVLLEDMNLHKTAYFERPSQPSARALIRAIFAFIEGQTYGLKQWALGQYRRSGKLADPGELALLEEVAFDLNDKGRVTRRSARIRTVANVRFAFEAFARSFGHPYEFDAEQLGWKAFHDALEVRHRLTHPKRAKDLQVEDEEVVVALAASEWFHHSTVFLLIEGVKRMAAKNTAITMELQDFETRWKESSKKTHELLLSNRTKNQKPGR